MQEMRPRVEETLEWIRLGDRDLLSAVVLLKRADPLIAPGLFHCQQAVEKWLKAILIWHGTGFPKVHDLGRIGALCLAVEPDLQDLVSTVADLTDFATVYRYPGAEMVLDASDATEWLAVTEGARSAILAKMPPAVREAL